MGKKRKKKPQSEIKAVDTFPWAAFQPSVNRNTLSWKRMEMARECLAEVNFYGQERDKRTYGFLMSIISTMEMGYDLGLVYIPATGKLCVVIADRNGIREVGSPE